MGRGSAATDRVRPTADLERLGFHFGARALPAWRSEIDAVPERERRVLAEAAERIPDDSPTAFRYVRVRRGMVGDTEAGSTWIAEHEEMLVRAVRDGPVIVERERIARWPGMSAPEADECRNEHDQDTRVCLPRRRTG